MTNYPPRYPQFKLLEMADREVFASFLKKHPPESTELTFANSFLWRKFDHTEYSLINGNLCVLIKPPNEPAYFLPPLGEAKMAETIDICLSDAPRLSRVPEWFVKKYCGSLKAEFDRNHCDYVYLATDLIELKGKKYDGKRNRIRKFTRHQVYQYLKLEPQHLKECADLAERWIREKGFKDWAAHAQREALTEALTNFSDLELKGGAIVLENKIAAFSLGEKLNAETAVVYFELADPKYEGLPQLINQEFTKKEWSNFKFINREQDLGIAGLRTAKLSYHPHHLVNKYNVHRIP